MININTSIKTMLCAIFFLILIFIGLYFFNISAVNKNNEETITIEIKSGEIASNIGETLKEKKLIRSITFFKIYLKIHKTSSLKAGFYDLNQTMNLKTIINILSGTKNYNAINNITLKEGQTLEDLALIIENKTNYTKQEVLNLMNNNTYIKELIDKYWFLTNDILDENIYYPLEGYLFPNTYNIYGISLEQIISLFLKETNRVLTPYKDDINESGYNVHELLSLASMVELEGNNETNRGLIAGVFYNRLNDWIPLGSDVTTYYAARKKITEKLTALDISSPNPYNTRNASGNFGLPVGPICNPGEQSINATINPTPNNYIYFVADTNGKIYFTNTYNEHQNIINELKEKGLW